MPNAQDQWVLTLGPKTKNGALGRVTDASPCRRVRTTMRSGSTWPNVQFFGLRNPEPDGITMTDERMALFV